MIAILRQAISTAAGRKPAALLRQPALHERAMAFGRELVASLLVSWREAQYAAQVSRDMLKLYQIVSASHPRLPRRVIYKRVVMARTGSDLNKAEAVLSWAEQSFASWPTERALTFSDVVHYMAVSEYLAVDDRMATDQHGSAGCGPHPTRPLKGITNRSVVSSIRQYLPRLHLFRDPSRN